MMTTKTEKIKRFHQAFGLPVNGAWTPGLLSLRNKLNEEEFTEMLLELTSVRVKAENQSAINRDDKARLLKEMVDIVYVVIGMAVALGLDFDGAFEAVHESNMSKLGLDGRPIYRNDGKVLKGPNYKPANLLGVV